VRIRLMVSQGCDEINLLHSEEPWVYKIRTLRIELRSLGATVMSARTWIVVAAILLGGIGGTLYHQYAVRRPQPWNAGAITATYVGTQLLEIDPSNARLQLSYELQNNTDTDYRLADGPGVVVMSRMVNDGGLSSQDDVRLAFPTFLPARQRVRATLNLPRQFKWPAKGDAALQNKLKDFINQRLSGIDGFVLFDQGDRCQIEFPRGWQPLELASAAD